MSDSTNNNVQSTILESHFGNTPTGEPVTKYTLINKNGVEASIINWGATLIEFKCFDKNGVLGDIVLGFDSLTDYLTNEPYLGATVGRFANRIANAECTIDGVLYQFEKNNGPNNNHAGPNGFEKKIWQASAFETTTEVGVKLTVTSPDGDQGFPGNLTVETIYSLNDNNELKIAFTATTDKTTVINLTNHSYFNLNQDANALAQNFYSPATQMTPLNEFQVPTGEVTSVLDTPFDFTQTKPLGQDIDASHSQIEIGFGYDHYFLLDGYDGQVFNLAAIASDPKSGRKLTVSTTEPGFQLYTGNFLNETMQGKGRIFERRCGFCIETQHIANQPNLGKFPTTYLTPNQVFKSQTIFSVGLIS